MIGVFRYLIDLLEGADKELAVAYAVLYMLRNAYPELDSIISDALIAVQDSPEFQSGLREKHAVVEATFERLRQRLPHNPLAEKDEKEILEILRGWKPGHYVN